MLRQVSWQAEVIDVYRTKCEQPLFSDSMQARFASPAESFLEGPLDLNTDLIRNPASTFFGCVAGVSMIGAGMLPKDILVVDRSLNPQDGNEDANLGEIFYESGEPDKAAEAHALVVRQKAHH